MNLLFSLWYNFCAWFRSTKGNQILFLKISEYFTNYVFTIIISSSPMGKLGHNKGTWFTQDRKHLTVPSQILSQQLGSDREHDHHGRNTACTCHLPGHTCRTAFQHLACLAQTQIGGRGVHIAPKGARQSLFSAGFQTKFFLILQLGVTAIHSPTCQRYQDFQVMQIMRSVFL